MISPKLWLIPAIAFFIFGALCAYFQPRIHNANRIDSMLRDGSVEQAISEMEELGREAFLKTWKPSFTFFGFAANEKLESIVDATEKLRPSLWIAEPLLAEAEASNRYYYMSLPRSEGPNPAKHLQNRIDYLARIRDIRQSLGTDTLVVDQLIEELVRQRSELEESNPDLSDDVPIKPLGAD